MNKIANNHSIWEEEHSGRRRVCMLMTQVSDLDFMPLERML